MQRKIAYLVSRFPKISETFILNEILELKRMGVAVQVFSLLLQNEPVRHKEAEALVRRTHYGKMNMRILLDQIYWLRSSPAKYFRAWYRALSGNKGSLNFLSRAVAVVPIAASFARKMQELNVAHVHAHWATHPALAAYVVKLLTGIPYSITTHAHDIQVERTMLEEKVREASFIVTISEYNRRLLKQILGDSLARKISVIHCGVDPAEWLPPARKLSTNIFNILCIGSLEERKGHRYLLEALSGLKKKGVEFECVFAGDGEERGRLEAQRRKLGLTSELKFAGWQPRDRVRALLAMADVMVLPSTISASGKTEGIPVALMDAMAMEVPVISTQVSGIPELIIQEQTGILVPDRSSSALTRALLRIYRDPEFARILGKNGRAKVVKDFNLHESAQALLHLLVPASAEPRVEAS